jgi:TonB family protein
MKFKRVPASKGFTGRLILVLLLAFPLIAQLTKSGLTPKRIVGMSYPRLAHIPGIQGTVRLIARVSQEGTVQTVQVASGHPLLAGEASETLSKWVFAGCASIHGNCEIEVTFLFVLIGNCDISSCPTEFLVDLPNTVTVRSKLPNGIAN